MFYFKGRCNFYSGFFIFIGIANAGISSSKSYKLHTALADEGGSAGTSKNYNSENSIGYSIGTIRVSGASYKVYGGWIPVKNAIPSVGISEYNDGQVTFSNPVTLKWDVVDKDQDSQRYYQVQISKDNFITLNADSGIIKTNSQRYTTPILPTTEGFVDYKWRVRVSDGYDYSGWETASKGFRLAASKTNMPIIWAKTAPGGSDIPSKLWQGCGDPYMSWEYPVTGVKPLGYSYAWGDMPDNKADTQNVFYQTPPDLLGDGVRIFNIKAENSAGNWGETASYELWIDRGSPIMGSYFPEKGAMLSSDKPMIKITVSDDKSGVDPNAVTMKINKSMVGAAYDANSQSIIYIPITPLSEGNNVVSVEAADFVGNKTSQIAWSFTVDTKGPEGHIIINNQDAVTNSIYVNLAFEADDSTTGVSGMAISNDGVFDNEQWEQFKSKKENWMLIPISGTRKVYVKFKDIAGNESEIINDTIELVIIAPDTIITSGPSLATKSKEALFTFKGTVDNCVFRWKFDDEEWSGWSKEILASKKDMRNGNHYFKVQAAKDVNKNSKVDIDEIDPVPAERTWTISDTESINLQSEKKKPFKFWKEE